MPDSFILLAAEGPCPCCGQAFQRTTLLCPERASPGVVAEILIERPGLWCAACGCAALDPADDAVPAALERPAPRRSAA